MAVKAPCTIGEMRSVGILMNNSPVNNESGGQYDNYGIVLACRGRLRQKSGKRGLEQSQLIDNRNFEWIIRAQDALVINPDSRWQISGDTFSILDYQEVDQIKHWFIFTLSKNG